MDALDARHGVQNTLSSVARRRQQQPGNRTRFGRVLLGSRSPHHLASVDMLPRGSSEVMDDFFLLVNFRSSEVWLPDNLKARAGEAVTLVGHATGVQIYVCQAGTDPTFAWVFKAPEQGSEISGVTALEEEIAISHRVQVIAIASPHSGIAADIGAGL